MTHPHELERLEAQFLEHLDGLGPAPDTTHLPPGDQNEVARRFDVIRALRHTPVEPDTVDRGFDPVAAFFGFDRENETLLIDGTRIRTLRDRRGIKAAAFTAAVNNAGGDLSPRDARDLERSKSFEILQPTASAIAAVLRSAVADFETTGSDALDQLEQFLQSPELAALIAQFERTPGFDPGAARVHLQQSLADVRFRADGDVTAHYLAAARAILEAWLP